VIEILEGAVRQARYPEHRVVGVAADTGGAPAGRFCFEVRQLAYETSLPVNEPRHRCMGIEPMPGVLVVIKYWSESVNQWVHTDALTP